MSRPQLRLAGFPPAERADAARNREALLCAAVRLVDEMGADAVTMDAVAEAANVGKGTVFRRFVNRAGLMAAVLNASETDWQRAVIEGPPPLGPGAPPRERLHAFGRSRLELNDKHADLILAATGRSGAPLSGAYLFALTHVRYLLRALGVQGDTAILATALLAPIEAVALRRPGGIVDTERLMAGWTDLARRIIGETG